MSDDIYEPIGSGYTITDGNVRCGVCDNVLSMQRLRDAADVGGTLFCFTRSAARCPINEVYERLLHDLRR